MLLRRQVRAAILTLTMVIVFVAALAVVKQRFRTLSLLVLDDPTTERIVTFLKGWAKDNSVELQVTRMAYDDLYDAVMRDGAGYDLMLIDDPWLPALVERGDVLSPVKSMTLRGRMREYAFQFAEVCYYRKQKRGAEARSPRRPGDRLSKCFGSYGNSPACAELEDKWELYATPIIGNVQLLVVASDLNLNERPGERITWPQLYDALVEHGKSAVHTRQTNRPPRFVFRGGSSNAAWADFLPFLRAWGGRMVTDQGATSETVTLDDPDKSCGALEFNLQLAQLSPVQHARLNDQDVYQYLANDEAEAGICWLAYVTGIAAKHANRCKDCLRYLPMPRPHAPAASGEQTVEQDQTGVTGAWLIAVGKYARNPDIARDFITHATSEDSAKALLKDGNPAPHEKLLGDASKFVRAARPRYAHPNWKEIENAAGLRIQQVYWQTISPSEALTRASFDVRKIVQPNGVNAAPVTCKPATDLAQASGSPRRRGLR